MTEAQKLITLQTLLEDGGDVPSEEKLTTYLTVAGEEILNWRWQYHMSERPSTVPDYLCGTQVYAVIAGFTQAGAEGEQTHIENSVHRIFRYADMLDYIHNKVKAIDKVCV